MGRCMAEHSPDGASCLAATDSTLREIGFLVGRALVKAHMLQSYLL